MTVTTEDLDKIIELLIANGVPPQNDYYTVFGPLLPIPKAKTMSRRQYRRNRHKFKLWHQILRVPKNFHLGTK